MKVDSSALRSARVAGNGHIDRAVDCGQQIPEDRGAAVADRGTPIAENSASSPVAVNAWDRISVPGDRAVCSSFFRRGKAGTGQNSGHALALKRNGAMADRVDALMQTV